MDHNLTMVTFSFLVLTYLCFPFSTVQLQCKTCAAETSRVSDVLHILRNLETSQICVWSKNLNEETSLQILNSLSYHRAVVIFNASSESHLPEMCMDNVVIVHDFPDQETCSVCFPSHRLGVRHTFMVLVVSDGQFQAEEWFRCWKEFGSARVSLVFLEDSRVFSLSSPLFPPRAFVQTVLSDLLKPLDITPATLTGREVAVATFNCSPFVIFRENNSLDRLDGIEGGVLSELKNKLNFSVRLAPLEGDGRWGVVIGVGDVTSWNGGIGKAMDDGTAEMAVCNIWNAVEFYAVAEFGPTNYVVSFSFLVPRPRLIEHRWHGLVTVLSGQSWVCTVVAGLATALCYSLHSYCHYPSISISEHLLEGVVVTWGKLTLGSWWARTGAAQLIGWWCVFVLLLTAVYTGSIVAQLTTPRYEPRLDTVRQLVEGGYRWINENNASSWQAAYFSSNDEWQKAWERRDSAVLPAGLVDAVRSRRMALPAQRWAKGLVFITIPGLDYERDLDDMRVMRETTSETHVSFIVAKGSPLLTVFQLTLLRFNEMGLFNYWGRRTALMRGEKYSKQLLQERDDHEETSAKQLTMTNLGPAFIILAWGLAMSLLVFLAEVLMCKHSKTSPYPFISCML